MAYFMDSFIYILILDNHQLHQINPSNIENLINIKDDSLSIETTDPSREDIDLPDEYYLTGFLYEVANDFEDYGRHVFKKFFKLLKDSNELIDIDFSSDEIQKRSYFISLINTVTSFDYRPLFREYRFDLDDSLYNEYMSTLRPPLIERTYILSLFPRSGPDENMVHLRGKIETLGGSYNVYFDLDYYGILLEEGELISIGNAPANSYLVSTEFLIPECSDMPFAAPYHVTFQEAQTINDDTIPYVVLAGFSCIIPLTVIILMLAIIIIVIGFFLWRRKKGKT